MLELNISNNFIGNASALKDAWDRDGYWFFKAVLDLPTIAAARMHFVRYLVDLGLTDMSSPCVRYNGSSLANLPLGMDRLVKEEVCQKTIMADPNIELFFTNLFDCPPFWVPFTHYRATPPEHSSGERFDMIHQDSVYNEGLPFLISWIPLSEIDEEIGGIAVAEGMHHAKGLHQTVDGEIRPIEISAIPAGKWRRAHYSPGDLLLMDSHTPHSGITNRSNSFRLSLDTRVMPSSGAIPIVGELLAIGADSLVVRDYSREHFLDIDDQSFCRDDLTANRISRSELTNTFAIGSKVIIAALGKRVAFMRFQR